MLSIVRRSIAVLLVVLGSSVVGPAALAPSPASTQEVAGTRPDCVTVRAEPRMQAFGWDHIVTVENGCEEAVSCSVATDVNPSPTLVSVPPGETRDTLMWRGSPASVFRAMVDCLGIAHRLLDAAQHRDQPVDLHPGARVVAAQHLEVGRDPQVREAAAQHEVALLGRGRGRHRAEDPHVGRQDERLVPARERHRLPAVLEQVHDLAEHAREIGAVHLVEDQHAAPPPLVRLLRELEEPSPHQRPLHRSVGARDRAMALHEVLVGRARVQDELPGEPVAASHEVPRQLPREVALPRPGWPDQDRLPAPLDRVDPAPQERRVAPGLLGDPLDRVDR